MFSSEKEDTGAQETPTWSDLDNVESGVWDNGDGREDGEDPDAQDVEEADGAGVAGSRHVHNHVMSVQGNEANTGHHIFLSKLSTLLTCNKNITVD